MSSSRPAWKVLAADGKEYGPYTWQDILEHAKTNRIARETLLNHPQNTQGKWVKAETLPIPAFATPAKPMAAIQIAKRPIRRPVSKSPLIIVPILSALTTFATIGLIVFLFTNPRKFQEFIRAATTPPPAQEQQPQETQQQPEQQPRVIKVKPEPQPSQLDQRPARPPVQDLINNASMEEKPEPQPPIDHSAFTVSIEDINKQKPTETPELELDEKITLSAVITQMDRELRSIVKALTKATTKADYELTKQQNFERLCNWGYSHNGKQISIVVKVANAILIGDQIQVTTALQMSSRPSTEPISRCRWRNN